jgi:hypothetical protein
MSLSFRSNNLKYLLTCVSFLGLQAEVVFAETPQGVINVCNEYRYTSEKLESRKL